MVRAIENGYVQKEIQDSAYRYQQEIEKGDRIVVGVNKFTIKDEPPEDILKVDPKLRDFQIRKLSEVKKQRNEEIVSRKLRALQETAKDPNKNLMPSIIDAVKEYASLGEICDVLRKEFGEYQESIVL